MTYTPLPPLPNSQKIRQQAIHTLISQLGIAKASIFLGELLWQPTDSLQLKDQLFATETVTSLYETILAKRNAKDPQQIT